MSALPPSFDLRDYTGPAFIGSILNWGLLGTLMLQIYSFSISFPNERLGIKCFVYLLLFLELIQTVLSTHWAWYILVSGWGIPSTVEALNWSAITIPIMAGLVSIIVQSFFAWRVFMLRRRSWIFTCSAILILLVALMQGLSAIVNGVRFYFYQSITDVRGFSTGVIIWLSGSLASDFLIAASMVTILLQHKSNSPFKKTETLITKLIVHTVETGVVTVITATIDLALYLSFPNTFLHIVPAVILGKLYSNIALANLNGRTRHRVWGDHSALTTSFVGGETHHLSQRVDADGRTKTIVQISTSITEERDEILKGRRESSV
ncbi:hypothetical protein AX14_014031 [Amanita brunnescens Koide BX004]|nr:hypothetical protein AX14_014031 [Amanita brunnescens Koide BX004]